MEICRPLIDVKRITTAASFLNSLGASLGCLNTAFFPPHSLHSSSLHRFTFSTKHFFFLPNVFYQRHRFVFATPSPIRYPPNLRPLQLSLLRMSLPTDTYPTRAWLFFSLRFSESALVRPRPSAYLLLLIHPPVLHAAQAAYFRMWWLLPTACLCGVGELVGWTGRLWSSFSPANGNPYLMQYVYV